MSWWAWGWIAWLILTLGGFAALEIPAVIRKNDSVADPDTLSDHLVRWFNIRTRAGRIVWTVVSIGLAALVAWLYPHILTGQAI